MNRKARRTAAAVKRGKPGPVGYFANQLPRGAMAQHTLSKNLSKGLSTANQAMKEVNK